MDALVAKLKSLPPDTPITSSQLAELLEAVISLTAKQTLTREPSFNELPDNHELTQVEVSQWLRKATSTLEKLRVKGTGPAYKPGKPVLYKVRDVKDWLANRRVSSTSEATVRGIRRLESLADLYPIFQFENEVPVGLEEALDYQEMEPQARAKEIAFFNTKEVLLMSSTIAPGTREYKYGSMDIVYLFMHENENETTGREPFSHLYEDINSLSKKHGIGINSIVREDGGNLAHIFAESGYLLENDKRQNTAEERGEKITVALEKLESMGLDLQAKNKVGLTPAQVAKPDSDLQNWLKARVESKMLRELVRELPSQEANKTYTGKI